MENDLVFEKMQLINDTIFKCINDKDSKGDTIDALTKILSDFSKEESDACLIYYSILVTKYKIESMDLVSALKNERGRARKIFNRKTEATEIGRINKFMYDFLDDLNLD